jgi:probable HAF family extracellular repeat protein
VPAQASTQTYSITDLGTLNGGFETDAYGMNSTGQVAGQAVEKIPSGSGYNYLWHAFLYSGGALTGLGTLGGDYSEARAINKYGDAAGYSNLCAGCYTYHAFLLEAPAARPTASTTSVKSWARRPPRPPRTRSSTAAAR